MSTIKVDTIKNRSSAINLPNNFKIGGNSIIQGYTASGTEPSSPATGDFWWDSSNEKLYRYINGEFKELTIAALSTNWWGTRGMRLGGNGDTAGRAEMDYFDLSVTSGNATDFGDLLSAVARGTAAGDGNRGLLSGGLSPNSSDTIQYWAFATLGNTVDFGDLDQTRSYAAAVSDATKAIVGGGDSSNNNVIQDVTIQTAGNASDFGDLTEGRYFLSSTNDLTHGIFLGGYTTAGTDRMDKITMGTLGNATDIGNLTETVYGGGNGVCSDNTTGLMMGGSRPASGSGSYNTNIDKLTIATAGNASDFGDLIKTILYNGQASNASNSRGVCIGGISNDGTSKQNVIQYVTISSPGNATDFGDLTSSQDYCAGVSGNAS